MKYQKQFCKKTTFGHYFPRSTSRSLSSGCGRIPEVTSSNLPAFVGVDSKRFRLLQRRLSMRTTEEATGALAYAEWIRMGELVSEIWYLHLWVFANMNGALTVPLRHMRKREEQERSSRWHCYSDQDN